MWFPNRFNTKPVVHSEKQARSLKFGIKEEEKVYRTTLEAKKKGADQLRCYRQADLRLCFHIYRLLVFSCSGTNDFNFPIQPVLQYYKSYIHVLCCFFSVLGFLAIFSIFCLSFFFLFLSSFNLFFSSSSFAFSSASSSGTYDKIKTFQETTHLLDSSG